jgi:hypothetical protein
LCDHRGGRERMFSETHAAQGDMLIRDIIGRTRAAVGRCGASWRGRDKPASQRRRYLPAPPALARPPLPEAARCVRQRATVCGMRDLAGERAEDIQFLSPRCEEDPVVVVHRRIASRSPPARAWLHSAAPSASTSFCRSARPDAGTPCTSRARGSRGGVCSVVEILASSTQKSPLAGERGSNAKSGRDYVATGRGARLRRRRS